MRAYSLDFRQKIVEIYETENISIAKLAKRFNVAKSFVQKILKQWRETGDLNPKKPPGSQQLKLSSSQIILVGDWVNEKNDITLKEIQKRLEDKENVSVSLSTICRILKTLNLTRKKKHFMQVNVIQIECNSKDLNTEKKLEIFQQKT